MIDIDIKYEFVDSGEKIRIIKSSLKEEDEHFGGIGYIKDIQNNILYITNQNVNIKIIRGLLEGKSIYINKNVIVDIILPSDVEIEECFNDKIIKENDYYILYTNDRQGNKNVVVDAYYGDDKVEKIFPCKKCTKEFYESINNLLQQKAFVQINDDANEFTKTYCTIIVEDNKIIDCKKTNEELIIDDNIWLVSFHLWGYLNNLNNTYENIFFNVDGIDRSNNTNIYISDKTFCQKNFFTLDVPMLFQDYDDFIIVENIEKKYTEKNIMSRYCWRHDKDFIDLFERCKSDNIPVTLKDVCLSIQLTTNGLYVIPKYNLYDFVYVGGIMCEVENNEIAIYDQKNKYPKNRSFLRFKSYEDIVNFYRDGISTRTIFKINNDSTISYEKTDSKYFIEISIKKGMVFIINALELSRLSIPSHSYINVDCDFYNFIKEKLNDTTVESISIPDINNINVYALNINFKNIETKMKESLINIIKNRFNSKYLNAYNLFLMNLLNLNLFSIKDCSYSIDFRKMIIDNHHGDENIENINKIMNLIKDDYKRFISFINMMYEIDKLSEIDEKLYNYYILKIEELCDE